MLFECHLCFVADLRSQKASGPHITVSGPRPYDNFCAASHFSDGLRLPLAVPGRRSASAPSGWHLSHLHETYHGSRAIHSIWSCGHPRQARSPPGLDRMKRTRTSGKEKDDVIRAGFSEGHYRAEMTQLPLPHNLPLNLPLFSRCLRTFLPRSHFHAPTQMVRQKTSLPYGQLMLQGQLRKHPWLQSVHVIPARVKFAVRS